MTLPSGFPKRISVDRFLQCAVVSAIIWYVSVCFAGYLHQRPMWNDEECVFQSIKVFSAKDMFNMQLQALQVFPRVYLFLIQQFAKPFQFDLVALRFLPFVAMMAAFFIWLKIIRYEFKEKAAYLTFVLSWSSSAVLLYYAAELKQYSMDVLVAALFILFLYHQEKLERAGGPVFYIFLFLLPSLILFSYITIFFCLFPLYNLLLSARENKKGWPAILVYGISLAAFLSISYAFDMRLRPEVILLREWKDYFVSCTSVPEFFKTFGEGTMNLLSRWFVERPRMLKKISVFFAMPGFLYMIYDFFKHIRKDRFRLSSLHTVAFILFLELFILGALKKYPFTVPRTSLFYCPVVLFFIITVIEALRALNPWCYKIVQSFYFSFLMFLAVSLAGITLAGKLTFQPVLW